MSRRPTPNPILRQAKRLRRLPQGRGTDTHPFISDRRTKEHNTPSPREGWGGLHITPDPSPWEESVDGWGKYGLKGQNKSAQGNALGIVRNQHSPRMGKRIIIPLTPFATLQWWAVILLPPSGAYPCCILSPRALPGAGISMPLRGVTNTHPQPLPKGGGLTPTPLFLTEGQKNIIPPPFGRAGVGFTSPTTPPQGRGDSDG